MKIDVHYTIPEADPTVFAEATAVVIDVVRATTTMVEALAHGARSILPTAGTEEAVKLATSLGRDDTLLCGERKGLKVEGFDLGNSPSEFTPDVVEGKRLVMSTTNGTRAFGLAQEAARVVACAFTNLTAVAGALEGSDRIVVLCAGRQDHFSIDDAVCAGHLLEALVGDGSGHELNDGARAARALARVIRPGGSFLRGTTAGQALEAIGLEDDLEICAEMDRHDIVPELGDQGLTVEGG